MAGDPSPTKRTVLVALVVNTVILGAGHGFLDTVQREATSTGSPGTPAPSVTPPEPPARTTAEPTGTPTRSETAGGTVETRTPVGTATVTDGTARTRAVRTCRPSASRSRSVSGPVDGTRTVREWVVAVTAVLFGDGVRVAKVTDRASFGVPVTTTGEVTLVLDVRREGSPALGNTLMAVENVAPGDSGTQSITIRNKGGADGRVRLFL